VVDLSVKLGPLELANPVLVASGTFGYGQESAGLTDLNALGGIVTKSISEKVRDGNPPPRLFETGAGMLNSIGLANVGVKRFLVEKLPFLRTLRCKTIVNVAGSTGEEFVRVVERLEQAEGIDAYELNFSCPNVKEGGLEFSQDPRITESVTQAVRRITRRPLLVKLTPNVTRVGDIARATEAAGADAVSLINTLTGMAIDIHTRKPRINTIVGGYSGPAIKPVALAKVYEVWKAVQIPIVGIGGIMDWRDAVEFLLAGATAIQVGTANFINPNAGVEIVEGLREFCKSEGIRRVAELTGGMKV
jgi:dihydroorotate dehydrogenase (NAD+) catalytic subunit